MAGFDSNTADISVILDAYMYLDYQSDSEEIQEKSLNEILEKIEKKYKDNERLEFLGDAVLELTSSDYIYKNYSNTAVYYMRRNRVYGGR